MRGSGRHDGEKTYCLDVWSAPAAPEVVHKRTDRLGDCLRGEPEPPVSNPLYAEHRWIQQRGERLPGRWADPAGRTGPAGTDWPGGD
ncbi:hypothetical protein BN6_55210 [Saccharothrix espanaensis DSM 44229]|uniref:Uncharacterized protein n=1 Tax=Saccharothrix espanaensis (strain ATCC 51144 / DSM 44229 / JCM 9112 / NBRC 15066 / NRRL 15764) TaxID=1179773 RepID=K0JXW2_SACES|nr:hypothetical protein BN6_55210 [Saccharothrix espanaensis DSM 44229]